MKRAEMNTNKYLNFQYLSDIKEAPLKEDKNRIIKLTRVNPCGEYGTYTIEKSITKEQLNQIENILGINLKDYKFN